MIRIFFATILTLTLLLTAGFQSSCPGRKADVQQARSYEEQFAVNTSRLAEYTDHGLKLTDQLVTSRIVTPQLGTAIVDKLLNVNHVNKLLVQSASQFIVIENGVRILRFTENDRMSLESLALALSVATKGVVNHPDWLSIEPKARDELNRILEPMTALALRIVSLIQGARKITVANAAYIELSYERNNHHRRISPESLGIVGLAYESGTAAHG